MAKIFFYFFSVLNPLSDNDELSRHENLTFSWTWILGCVLRSFATHVSLCNTLSSNKPCPKTVKILAVERVKLLNLFLLKVENQESFLSLTFIERTFFYLFFLQLFKLQIRLSVKIST